MLVDKCIEAKVENVKKREEDYKNEVAQCTEYIEKNWPAYEEVIIKSFQTYGKVFVTDLNLNSIFASQVLCESIEPIMKKEGFAFHHDSSFFSDSYFAPKFSLIKWLKKVLW